MKIVATSSGGFAGLPQRHAVDTTVSPDGPLLEAALASSGFFQAGPAPRSEASGADLLRWTITVEADGRRHSVTFTQDGSPASAPWERLLARILAA
ncbi:protealysin inhibitor emfourin [[Empedobacter] haloabium]|uniref:Protealysin inhibitor emfourin n=1 Tax=[Empedobacter] haloabium TaxID=592317 RepID=A0ABZ1UNZ7_9BURK